MSEQLEARLREQAKFYGNPDLLTAAADALAAMRPLPEDNPDRMGEIAEAYRQGWEAGRADAEAALAAMREDRERLDWLLLWLLLDYQPDGIGGIDLWERVDAEDEGQYLRAARAAIDDARGVLPAAPASEGER